MSVPSPLSEPPQPIERKEEIAPPLGELTASGFKWSIVFNVLMRFVSLGSQIVLARLLMPDEFGQYAEAFITISIVATLRDAALSPVLIARQKELPRLESDGFWLSLFFGVISALVIAGVGCWWWFRPGGHPVAGMLWLNAAASPFMTIGNISATKFWLQMRFVLNAKLTVINSLTTTGLTLLFASRWFGWGPYALMVPQIVGGLMRAGIYLYFAPPRVHWRINRANVISLVLGTLLLTYSGLASQIVGQGDNFVITRNYDEHTVGIYSWAFNLSYQSILLLASNLMGMVLPTMAMLNDERPRQTAAYLRVGRTLAAIGLPFCFLQILFAAPIVKPLFTAKYAGAEPIIAVISFGLAFSMVNMFSAHLMLARKENKLLAGWSTATIISFMVLVYAAERLGGVIGVAWGVAVFHMIIGTVGTRLALGNSASWKDVLAIFWPPLLACVGAAIPTMSMALLFPQTYRGNASLPVTLGLISIFALLFLGIYALLFRPLDSETYAEILRRADGMTRRIGIRLVKTEMTR